MEGAMSNATSLTDAVKAAAARSASLTDAVKEAARGGADSTIVSFPRLAFESRHETAPGVGASRAAAPDVDAPAHAAMPAEREHAPEQTAEKGYSPEPIEAPKPARPSTSRPP